MTTMTGPTVSARKFPATLRIGTALASGLVGVFSGPLASAQAVPASGSLLPVLDAVHGTTPATVTTGTNSVSVDLNDTNQVVTWKSFDIGTGNSVNFSTTSTSARLSIINRVVGDGTNLYKSEIYGPINGQSNVAVWLINPSGITFGPGGAYSGGSLVLSTLDFATEQAAEDFVNGVTTTGDVTGSGGAIALTGSGTLSSSGTTLLLGEDVLVGKSINPASAAGSSSGAVTLALAHAVQFSAGVGDPLSFTIPAGTSLAVAGISVTGGAAVKGDSVKLVAASPTAMLGALLSTDTGTQLTATGTNGDVTLLVMPGSGGPNSIVAKGSLTATGSVNVSADGPVTVGGDVVADQQYLVSGSSVTLGQASTTVDQGSVTGTTITATGSQIFGLGNLTLRTNVGNSALVNSIILDSAQIAFDRTTTIDAGSGGVLVGQQPASSIDLGTVKASRLTPVSSTTIGVSGDFTAQDLQIANGLRLEVGGNIRVGSISTSTGGSTIALLANGAISGLAGTSTGTSDTNFGRLDLSAPGTVTVSSASLAQLGTVSGSSVTVTAGRRIDGTASAGGRVDLASATSGPITLTALNSGGTGIQDGQVLLGTATVAGTALVNAASAARVGSLTATAGDVSVTAGGDITGLIATTPDPLSLGYGSVNLAATAGAVSVTAGGSAQLGTVAASGNLVASAAALALDTGTIGGSMALTAAAGPIVLGTATSGGDATLLAPGTGRSITITSLTGNQTTGTSGTSVMAGLSIFAGSIAATRGDLTVRAAAGSVTGLSGGSPDALTLGFGSANLSSGNGSISITADGAAQIGALSTGADAIVNAGAVAVTSATSGGALILASTSGALILGTGTSGAGATLTSASNLRLGSLTAAGGPASVTARGGDVTGLASGTPDPFSLGFGSADLSATGALTVTATNGAAQLGALNAGGSTADLTVTAQKISATSATAGNNATLTATSGGLGLGTASAAGTLTLSATDALTLGTGTSGGDATLTATGPSGTITITALTGNQSASTSGTSVSAGQAVRAGSITAARGNLMVTATDGAVTGLAGGTSGPLDAAFASANLAAGGNLLVSANTIVQLGSAAAGGGANDLAASGSAVAVSSASAGRNISVTASNGDLIAGTVTAGQDLVLVGANGALHLDTGTVQRDATLTKTGTGGDLQVGSLSSGVSSALNGTLLSSSTSVRIGSINAATGPLAVTASTGDVTGLSANTPDPFALGFGSADLATTSGGVTVNATSGAVQLGTVSAGFGDVRANALRIAGSSLSASSDVVVGASGGPISLVSITAGRDLALTGAGGIALGSGSAGRDSTVAASGASGGIAITSLTTGSAGALNGAAITASQSIRAGTIVATTGGLSLTSANGAVTGLAGTPQSGIGFAPALDANFTGASLTASGGPLAVNAATLAQIALASAGGSISVSANAISLGTLQANGASLTANAGPLLLDTGTVTGAVTLAQSGSASDELRVRSLAAATASVSATGAIRAGTITTTGGALSLAAANGDITGLAASTASNGTDTGFGRATLGAATNLSVAAGGLVQGGDIAASTGTLAVTAGSVSSNGAIDVLGVRSGSTATLTAKATNPTDSIRTGAIKVGGPAVTGSDFILTNAAGNAGTVAVSDTVASGGAYHIDAVGSVTLARAGLATATQSAVGGVAIASRTGNVGTSASALQVVSDSAGTGGRGLSITATAGAIDLGGATLTAGTVADRQSAMTLAAAQGVTFDTVNAAQLTVRAGGAVTAATIVAGNATAPANPSAIDIASSAGALLLDSVTTIGTGQDIVLAAATDVTSRAGLVAQTSQAGSVNAATGSIAITSGGAIRLNSVSSTGGDVTARAGTAGTNGGIDLANVSATGGVLVDALANRSGGDQFHDGAIVIRTATGNRSLTVSNVLRDSGGGFGSIRITSASSGSGDVIVDAARDLTFGALTAQGSVAARARGALSGSTVVAIEDAAIEAGSIDLGTVSAGDDIDLTASGALAVFAAGTRLGGPSTRTVQFGDPSQIVFAGSDSTPRGTLNLTSGGPLLVTGSLDAAGSISASSTGSTATLSGVVTADGNYTVTAQGDVVLGGAGTTSQAAKGALSITSSSGSIGQGAGSLTLTANSDGIGSEPLSLDAAGGVALGNSTLIGGTAAQSPITAAVGSGAIALGAVNGASLTASAATGFTSGAISVGNAASGADPNVITGPSTLAITAGSGPVSTQAITVSGAGHDARLLSDGTITTGALTVARSLLVTGANAASAASFAAPALTTAGGSATIAVTGSIQLGTVATGSTLSLSGSSVTVTGSATSGNMVATGTTTTITASGAVALGSSLSHGATQINAGSLAVTGALAANTALTLVSSGATDLGSVSAGTTLTASGSAISVTGAANSAGTSGTTTSLAATGAISLGQAASGGATRIDGASLLVGGPLTAGSSITTRTSGATDVVSTTAGTLLDMAGASVTVRNAVVSGTSTTLAGTAVNLGSVAAGTTLVITGGTLTVAGAATSGASGGTSTSLTASGAISLGSAASQGGTQISGSSLSVAGALSAGGAITSTTSGATTLNSVNAQSTLSLTANPLTVSGTAQSGQAMTLAGASISIGGPVTAGTTLTATTTTGDLTFGGATSAGGAVVLDVAGVAGLAAVTTSSALKLIARDAVLAGTIGAMSIDLTDRGPSGNTLRLGDNAPGSGGFALSAAEINLLSPTAPGAAGSSGAAATPTVTFHAGVASGTGASATLTAPQDVAIGTLAITNPRLQTLSIDAIQRIDVTGALTSTSLTALRLGGVAPATAASAPAAGKLATVLRIAAKADGSGGRIDIGRALLDLQAATIGAGQDTGFLQLLGVTPGSTQTLDAKTAVSNPFSPLYNAMSQGGAAYTSPSPTLIRAGTTMVSYTKFAFAQNTQTSGSNAGVDLGNGSSPALVLLGTSPNAGPFEIFGTINGIGNTATSLLGAATIAVSTAVDRTTSRINGCLIGSAAGCLSTPISPPSLDVIDQSRKGLVLPKADFKLPFNPLVGTNNDSLFGDVGAIGLGDLPIAAVDCADGSKSCGMTKPVQPEGKK